MDDRRLDELLDEATQSYRMPPDTSFDAIWNRVEAEAFASRPAAVAVSTRRWGVAFALAASLVIGVLAGRWSMRGAAESASVFGPTKGGAAVNAQLIRNNDPYQRTTEEFLSRSAVLLASLPANGKAGARDEQFVAQASQLLTTTRVLLDSPVGTDRRMKELLQDLELVLAQVARMQAPRHRAELTLITEALQERDLVPRIKSAVADLSISDH